MAIDDAGTLGPLACSCWLGEPGATFGDSRIREACAVHGLGAELKRREALLLIEELSAEGAVSRVRFSRHKKPRLLSEDVLLNTIFKIAHIGRGGCDHENWQEEAREMVKARGCSDAETEKGPAHGDGTGRLMRAAGVDRP